jgi:hypothetical protein
MTESVHLIEALDARVERRSERRNFFKAVVGATAVGAGAFAFANAAQAQTVTDADVLNFALNLEYLEANFYYYAVFGTPIPASSTTGVGTPVLTTSLAANAGAHVVPFKDPLVAQYAREIAADELAHVDFLRAALGTAAVAQPAIDIGIAPDGAFSNAARAAGLIGASTAAAPTFFDPYSTDENFLLGAFIFEDVGVTAYKGSAALLTNKTYIDAAAGILAAEAYHAAIIRTTLDQKGIAAPSLRTATESISTARDSLDGTSDLDQGIAQTTTPVGLTSNIVPADNNGIAFSRTAAQVLNIVYLNKAAVTLGGFFPAGVNGSIKTSANNAA